MRNPARPNSIVNTQKQALLIEFDRVLGMVVVDWQRETQPGELLDFSKMTMPVREMIMLLCDPCAVVGCWCRS